MQYSIYINVRYWDISSEDGEFVYVELFLFTAPKLIKIPKKEIKFSSRAKLEKAHQHSTYFEISM